MDFKVQDVKLVAHHKKQAQNETNQPLKETFEEQEKQKDEHKPFWHLPGNKCNIKIRKNPKSVNTKNVELTYTNCECISNDYNDEHYYGTKPYQDNNTCNSFQTGSNSRFQESPKFNRISYQYPYKRLRNTTISSESSDSSLHHFPDTCMNQDYSKESNSVKPDVNIRIQRQLDELKHIRQELNSLSNRTRVKENQSVHEDISCCQQPAQILLWPANSFPNSGMNIVISSSNMTDASDSIVKQQPSKFKQLCQVLKSKRKVKGKTVGAQTTCRREPRKLFYPPPESIIRRSQFKLSSKSQISKPKSFSKLDKLPKFDKIASFWPDYIRKEIERLFKHKKCSLIKLIRFQIVRVREEFRVQQQNLILCNPSSSSESELSLLSNGSRDVIYTCGSWISRLTRSLHLDGIVITVFQLIFFCGFLWLLLFYGVIIGVILGSQVGDRLIDISWIPLPGFRQNTKHYDVHLY